MTRKRKHIIRQIAAATAVIWAGAFALWTLSERTRLNDIETAKLATYQVELQAYQTAVSQHIICLERIDRQEASVEIELGGLETDRQFLAILSDAFHVDASEPAVARILALYDKRETEIRRELAPDTLIKCPPLPISIPVSPITGEVAPVISVVVTTG